MKYGGPDGEIGAAMRYLSQRYTMPFKQGKGLLTDIGSEEPKWRIYVFGKDGQAGGRCGEGGRGWVLDKIN